jgi:hypothetical protein
VSIVYQNLNVFLEKSISNDTNIEYLAFGENPKIESKLLEQLEIALTEIEDEPVSIDEQSCLFITTSERDNRNTINDATIITLFDDESD